MTAVVDDGLPEGHQSQVLQRQVGIGIFAQCAKKSAQIQQRILAAQAEPEKQKRLRTFATMEAARMIGVSESYLRQLTRETCGIVARMDMPGEIKSPNVSNATALALYIGATKLGLMG